MNCPVCGKEMEEGDLRAYGGRGVALSWKNEGKSLWRAGESLDWGAFWVSMNAFRCSNCKIVVFNYGSNGDSCEREAAPDNLPFEE